ncbi:MAG TPA: hypothetical protein P5204_00040 [Kiritimatiellia bacterium]|nr:hypothetical protein [Kiritimatiellia bacterium]
MRTYSRGDLVRLLPNCRDDHPAAVPGELYVVTRPSTVHNPQPSYRLRRQADWAADPDSDDLPSDVILSPEYFEPAPAAPPRFAPGMRVRALPGCNLSNGDGMDRSVVPGEIYVLGERRPESDDAYPGQWNLDPNGILAERFLEPVDDPQPEPAPKETPATMKTRLIVNEDGTLVRETYESLTVTGKVKAMLQKELLGDLSILTPDLGATGFASSFRMLLPAKPNDGDPYLSAFRLKELNFRAPWKNEGGVLRPDFASRGADLDPASMDSLKCPMPDFVRLWLLLELPWNAPGRDSLDAGLLALVPANRKLRWSILPLPNLHSDGHLCYGPVPELPSGGILAAKKLLETWTASRWNGDLFEGNRYKTDKFNALFSWTPDGKLVERPAETWAANCDAVSGYSALVEKFMEKILGEEAK